MASADEIFPQTARCDICGAELGDEVVVQEFADGSLARLCGECAAGADLADAHAPEDPPATIWPELPPEQPADTAAEADPLEKTRELLMPVTDLIALQGEMQSALERLAGALERFALEMITESQGRSAVQSRVQELERELDKTRTQLSEAEFLLSAATKPGQFAPTETPPMPTIELPEPAEPVEPMEPVEPPAADGPESGTLPEARPGMTFAEAVEAVAAAEPLFPPPAAPPAAPPAERRRRQRRNTSPVEVAMSAAAERRRLRDRRKGEQRAAGGLVAPPAGAGGTPCCTDQTTASTFVPAQVLAAGAWDVDRDDLPTFRIDEVQAAQRYYNESPYVGRIGDVRKSLGRPRANVTRAPGETPLAFVTITWDIVWYQYVIDLRRDLPSTAERVCLFREGMDLDELPFQFRDKNAVVNDDGKLDASELEVRLLSDPSALITEMVSEDTVLMDDLTEEHWGSRVAPEFKWDD